MKADEIIFNIEASDKGCAFFAIYAGLRMYMELREKRTPKDHISFSAAEAYCMLQQLSENFPEEYKEAEEEFNEVYTGEKAFKWN